MGSVVMQEGRPVAYFSKKFSGAQLNYTTGEKEMLAIVESLKEFRTMLYGTELHIHTDHANLTFKTATSQRVMRWRAYVEEYAPTLYYIKGETNILADTFSRLPRLDQEDGKVELTDAYFAEADEFHDLLEDDDLFEWSAFSACLSWHHLEITHLITNSSETNSRLVKPWLLPVSGTPMTTSSKS